MEQKQSAVESFLRKYDDIPKFFRKSKYLFIFCMSILSILSFCIFYLGINFSSIMMAFRESTGRDPQTYQETFRWSFANFRRFWEEMSYQGYAVTTFKAALKNTLFLFVLGNLWSIPMQYITSYYLYKKICGWKIFRWILYFPSIISSVVMITIFKNIVEVNGLLSTLSMKLGFGPVTFLLSTDKWAKWTLLVYNDWMGFAGSYIVLTAAMMRIPMEVIESAKLDGVGPVREFFKIIIPMIWPTVHILLLQKITGILSADGPVLLLTGGAHDTYTIGYWFYSKVIMGGQFNYPSAIGLIMTLFVAPIAIIARKLLDKVYADVEY